MSDEVVKKSAGEWVDEAWRMFVKDVEDADPTDPVKALQAYFDAHASEGLKERAKAEGKTAEGCWAFVERVAKKALGGRTGHVDPRTVYAVAMHWWEDVPADWDGRAPKADGEAKAEAPSPTAVPPASVEDAEKPAKAAKKPAKAKKAKGPAKPKGAQGFFFDVLEGGEAGDADQAAD